jgi:hypothetical protein
VSRNAAGRIPSGPIYWFVVLEKALAVNDFEAAARAQEELDRLGVAVTYPRLRGCPERAEGVAQ